jgi:hypothetical protein
MNLEQVLARWAREARPPASEEAPAASPVAGRWRNEWGSEVELVVDGARVSGTYTTAGDKPIAGPVTGWTSGDIVAFSVRWPTALRSITSWVGQVVDEAGAPVLKTLWHLVIDIADADEVAGLWATVQSGADTFR